MSLSDPEKKDYDLLQSAIKRDCPSITRDEAVALQTCSMDTLLQVCIDSTDIADVLFMLEKRINTL